MKTRERLVYFYDLAVESYTGAEGITTPACADLHDILARVLKSKPIGHVIESRGHVRVEIADWKYASASGTHRILINHADRSVSDVAFRDFNSRKVRKGGKTKIEGIESSAHVIVRPNADGRSALILLSAGAGVSRETVEKMFLQCIRVLGTTQGNADLFEFAHPSGEKASDGKPVTYRVRYKVDCFVHKSRQLDDALKHGSFVSLDLVAPKFDQFDAGGNLRVQATTISIKADNPALVTGPGLRNAVRSFLRKHPQDAYDSVRVRFKSDSNTASAVTLRTNELEDAFSRKERVALSMDVEAQQDHLESVIVAAMESLL